MAKLSIIYFLSNILYISTPKGAFEAIHVIGKPEWFCARKFGWGVGIKTKEGWLYILGIIAVVAAATYLLPLEYRLPATFAIVAVLVLDVLAMMPKVYAKLDEREQRHQLVAERNASFTAVAGLVAYGAYLGITLPASQLEQQILPIAGIAVAMALVKGATLLYVEKKH